MARALNLINSDEPFFGHKACAGCGGSLAVRIALKVLGDRAIAILPAGCMSAVGFNFPQLAFGCNAMISTFAGTASLMTGVAAGMKRKGETDFTVVGFAGDGGTADIGIQALSGAIDRNDDILYICYDNEAYMNTGIQQSSLTPYGASTTTSPVDRNGQATLTQKKDMFRIVSAMGAPYVATASVGYLDDYATKVEKASHIHGTKFIHVLAPCPTGWGSPVDATVELAREAVDCGLWRLAECEGGVVTVNRDPRKKTGEFAPVEHYLKSQRRFKHMSDEDIRLVEAHRDAQWS
ncbi:MAG: thiamine pyrophosphate-dependent enzyme [Coriobacteriales bacterium]|nr:thiamine pyrophosphate-dependent enzyme [Coriobacteriaceae bacterium]MDY2723154.1 thiamine pyrophosphate-dependent enzyme [Coriobacteriales bacterium]